MDAMEMSTREGRERLIDEVKRYPVLYDTKHENHRDIDVRDRCWTEISERLGANCEILKREWKILRDSLRQSLKRDRSGATTKAGVPCKRWRFESRMSFILPYMTKRRKYPPPARSPAGRSPAGRSPERSPEPAWGARAALAGDADPDALDLFFASACQSTRRLPRRHQNTVKRQILEVLARAEDAYEDDPDAGEPDAPKPAR